MNKDHRILLVKYEMPRIAKYISNDYLQEILAKYLAWKINRKLKRFAEYQEMENFVNYIRNHKK